MTYLIIKSLHIIFMVTWFAAVFYLPRLFVYHTQTLKDGNIIDELGYDRFCIMERKLFVMMSIGALFTVVFGFWLMGVFKISGGWLGLKLAFVGLLIAFHVWCGFTISAFKNKRKVKSEKFYRLINEVPVVALFAIVFLAIIKPF